MVNIRKYSGDIEPFSEKKLRHSLERSNVPAEHIETIVPLIKSSLYEGMTTKELYTKTYSLLKQMSRSCAGRYSLKHALRDLGPTGFPFEKFIARLFQHQNFQTRTGQILQGKCIPHEVDVIVFTHQVCYLVECKFHVDAGIRMSVHVPMYVYSRFEDIRALQKTWNDLPITSASQYLIATNAKLSEQSVAFAQCKKMHLLAWGYPEKKGLEQLIKEYALYPITVLTHLKKAQRQLLLEHDVILCKEIQDNIALLKQLNFTQPLINKIINEAEGLVC